MSKQDKYFSSDLEIIVRIVLSPVFEASHHGEDQLSANCVATPTKKNKIGKRGRATEHRAQM